MATPMVERTLGGLLGVFITLPCPLLCKSQRHMLLQRKSSCVLRLHQGECVSQRDIQSPRHGKTPLALSVGKPASFAVAALVHSAVSW